MGFFFIDSVFSILVNSECRSAAPSVSRQVHQNSYNFCSTYTAVTRLAWAITGGEPRRHRTIPSAKPHRNVRNNSFILNYCSSCKETRELDSLLAANHVDIDCDYGARLHVHSRGKPKWPRTINIQNVLFLLKPIRIIGVLRYPKINDSSYLPRHIIIATIYKYLIL